MWVTPLSGLQSQNEYKRKCKLSTGPHCHRFLMTNTMCAVTSVSLYVSRFSLPWLAVLWHYMPKQALYYISFIVYFISVTERSINTRVKAESLETWVLTERAYLGTVIPEDTHPYRQIVHLEHTQDSQSKALPHFEDLYGAMLSKLLIHCLTK